ncbi:MAG TPA: hypothetical protein PLB91_07570 [Spirochaetales bacterium]|nr:hypothetical protein [Spirochaetales bacterium]HRY54736.1 hypothetical protein [Spirochaetia bacterium]HRZ64991.1 hypothetical protein [Spirochaetia bacterium]
MRAYNAFLGLVLVGGLCLASCWSPPFDLDISESARFTGKLDEVGSFLAEGINSGEVEGGYFLPHRILEPEDGFWVCARDSELRLRFVDFSSGSAKLYQSSSYANVLGKAALASSLSAASIASLSPTVGRGVLMASSSGSDGVKAVGVDDWRLLSSYSALGVSGPASPLILGAHRSPYDETRDRLALLYRDSSTGSLWGGAVLIDNATDIGSPSVALVMPAAYADLAIAQGSFFACSPAGYYYLSGRLETDGSLRTLRWDSVSGLADPVPLTLPGVGRRLTAILADGRLLARDEDTTLVYDAAGQELFEIPTGFLRFVHEVYDSGSGTWYSYFTRSFFIAEGDDESWGDLRVDLYRCRSDKLSSLAD